jgi:hypothetical protein
MLTGDVSCMAAKAGKLPCLIAAHLFGDKWTSYTAFVAAAAGAWLAIRILLSFFPLMQSFP